MDQDKIRVTVELSPELVEEITTILQPGRTVADTIEELIVGPVSQERFLQKDASQELYAGRGAVSDEETIEALHGLVPAIEKLLTDHRPEAVAYGLLAASLDLCTRIAQEAGYVHPEQHGGYFAEQILAHLRIGAGDLFMKPDAAPRSPEP
jgi:hypothetical protein